MLHTPLHHQHTALQAKLIPFGEWEMPLHYGSQLEEHHAVRQRAGLFDVSHMMITDLSGKDSCEFLRHILANDVAKLKPTQALYSCLLNPEGGVLDDSIVYFLDKNNYRLITNATTREKIKQWLLANQAHYAVSFNFREDLAILALQGPRTFEHLHAIGLEQFTPTTLRPFYSAPLKEGLVARTGYTGELGVELMLPANNANRLWEQCMTLGIQPCGLGARDTLRLEMGYNLYGLDMDETTSPLESNLAWTVSLTPERTFIGKAALEAQLAQGVKRHLVGLRVEDKGIPRSHYEVFAAQEKIGEVTSGTFSPTLMHGVALARLHQQPPSCTIKVRDKLIAAQVVKPPFIKR